MSSVQEKLPGVAVRRWLALVVSPHAMESVFDPFFADLQAEWLHVKSTRSESRARWSLVPAYGSLITQLTVFAMGSLLGNSYRLAPAGGPTDGEFSHFRGSRYAVPVVIAALITFGLFVLMSVLITSRPGDTAITESVVFDIVRVKVAPEPPEKAAPSLPQPPQVIPQTPIEGLPVTREEYVGPRVLTGPEEGWGGSYSGAITGPFTIIPGADQSEIPTFTVPPIYPRRALQLGIEGWVEVEFTVTAVGSVTDVVVLRSKPSSVFDRAALRAISRWKYEPMVVGGEAVARPGMQKRLLFSLDEDVARR